MQREDRVTVQGPVKKQQPDGMSHRAFAPPYPRGLGKGAPVKERVPHTQCARMRVRSAAEARLAWNAGTNWCCPKAVTGASASQMDG